MRINHTLWVGMLVVLSSCQSSLPPEAVDGLPILLDQEVSLDSTKALNSGTQSLNRYFSILRSFEQVQMEYLPTDGIVELKMTKPSGEAGLQVKQINADFLVPLLPYNHGGEADAFDLSNLVLAEYARNGVNLSYQPNNDQFGFFNSPSEVFDEEGEFVYTIEGTVAPNPEVKPKRFSVVNNCLDPGLWELSASDAVGEMYHGWFQVPPSLYYRMIQGQNELQNSVESIQAFMENPQTMEEIPLALDRLRKVQSDLPSAQATVAADKQLGGYSTQDSRRKIQRGFFQVLREEEPVAIETFSDLQPGDVFDLHSFQPPGIYNHKERTQVPYRPEWETVNFRLVEPNTSYGGRHDGFGEHGYLEIELVHTQSKERMIAGNIPISLIVFSEDYKIPAFGAGVLSSSELIERRHIRLQQGPYPHYAYLAEERNGNLYLKNNHPAGYEQIYLRPFEEEGQLYLRLTVVSYERIIDLLEFNIPVPEELAKRIRAASSTYKPPIYEVYTDTNIL
ncbi:MAG: hypothetical protein AAGH79_06035 [Bacteroidota bacterium]